MDVRTALKRGMSQLRAANVPSYTLAAELLLMHALSRDRAWLYSHPEARIDAVGADNYLALIDRRAAGEPTQYLTGRQEFWGLEFEVNPAVLIPRPETEHVIEVALERLGSRGFQTDRHTGERNPSLRIADVGTGSGCIAVALARELPHAEVIASDISAAALEVALRNATRHGVADRVQFIETDLLESVLHGSQVAGRGTLSFDLIASNPPYVARDEADTLPREVRDHEPHAALFAGADGTEIYRRLIDQAGSMLQPGGLIVLELGHNSAPYVRELLTQANSWTDVHLTNDLAGIPRVIAATRMKLTELA
jgi:release factor glutamine methyltransferase